MAKFCNKSITLRIDEELLNSFKAICKDTSYQSKIKLLMKKYVEEANMETAKRVMKDKSINTDFLTK
jgi:antitoxin component of RelBE/YafQ-DinJ toxin-antitoxin module